MRTHPIKLVTIVAEAALEYRLTTEIRALGARGFTIVEARGEGTRGGARGADAPGTNIRLEALVSAPVAEAIVEHLVTHYFADYSIIAYTADVDVVRTRKFAVPAASAAMTYGEPHVPR